MLRLIVSRAGQAALTLFFLTALIFVLSRVLGNPLDLLLPPDVPQDSRLRLAAALGLDKPLWTQYLLYLEALTRGDFGRSILTGEPVTSLLAARLPASLLLGTFAMLLTLVIAIPLGIIAATNKGRPLDSAAQLITLIGMSAPSFWIGIVLINVIAVQLRWLPAGGTGDPRHMVLPALTLSAFPVAGVARLVRSSMIEALSGEYILFARAKGVPEMGVVWKHALRNALVPVLGFIGIYLALMITLAITVEVVFAWPGLGTLALNAIVARDFPVMQGVILQIGVVVIVINLTVDLLYLVVDPRLRHGG